MFTTSARNTSEYSILECPQIRPLPTITKWKCNNIELAPNCPRCASSNTKFCYYNNYSLSQPRYFCKGCRRYWTKGGSLRNVPVGAGCRKSRRSRAARLHAAGQDSPAPGVSATRMGAANESENNTSIDLAVVFARYVNHQTADHQRDQEFSSPGGSCSASGSSSDNFQASSLDMEIQMDDINSMFECQKPMDLVNIEADDQLQQVPPQISMPKDINENQDFLCQNSYSFEMHNIFSDELSQDLLWTDSTEHLPNFGSQQSMDQFQDYDGSFSVDEQLTTPDNLINSWNTFDPSGYEIFSRP